MQGQKSHSFKLYLWKNIFVVGAGFCASFLGLSFNADEVSALFVPTLSASVDQANLQVNGNQVINSSTQTTELPLNFTVNTNNRTGYTATISAETNNTSLSNSASSTGAKISSISSSVELNDLPNNSWGYKFGTSMNYAPIPALSTPAQILQTTGKTNGNELNQLSIGMKLADNLESGNYQNKLVLSFVSNPYQMRALMTEGTDFNAKLKSLETATNKIEHFKKSALAPVVYMNTVDIQDEDSDYRIKLWLDPTDKTAYYHAEPEKVYLNTNSSMMFFSGDSEQKIKNILELDLSKFDTSRVTNMSHMFNGMRNLTTLNLSNFNTSNVTNMGGMFFNMTNLTTLNLSNFDTSKVTNMGSMFYGISNLTTLNLSNFNTSQVTIMGGMFYGMSNLTTLNLSNFNTSKTTDMRSMFNGMTNLASLNISSFNTENVENMSGMFSLLRKIEHLDLSHFRTDKVTNMGSMFYQMTALKTINLSNFNTANVTDMSSMFSMDDNLTELDLSSFATPKVENFGYMFASFTTDNRLTRIYTSGDWDTSRAIAAGISAPRNVLIFANRVNLVGNNGWTSATPNNVGLEALRIDRHLAPGYFTLRS
ncbi:BspA family leucine-rich repeat surface protein [Candidatus Saccharibacteria bacterium]|nr:BspA family leucine-rich repeat surface protein [Candidatus Saccharibacteria bacterium]